MWFLILFILFYSVPASADDSLKLLMERMQKRYETLGSLKANFTQTYESSRFSDQMVEKGIVYLRKGGLMRWEYNDPEDKIFVSDGVFYYYYVPEDKQVIKVPADQKTDQRSPTLFLAGRGDFLRDFRAEWADPRKGSNQVKLTPIKPQPDFRYLLVDVDPAKGLILRLQVVDAFENRTDYRFQNIEENPRLPEQYFAFKAPPGTDVIFQRPESE
jgi:outer membrane lipoprotein carrier protein